ncbi:hypothetical protein CKM354_000121000 [Cercospora kikuchii]|uniref:Uncharacterized protein n=1 Tax=Cercospora kikuchii TaxID=84275 RepID=A0A9P3C7E6_9PEZI|nr:uncharacterized protein CKM354_000121000 [Cercospora kikuchii]GIZ37774.1 hypothetical protein CKM354_000121000 [Cercospora kikuchii]
MALRVSSIALTIILIGTQANPLPHDTDYIITKRQFSGSRPSTNFGSCVKSDGHIADRTTAKACGVYGGQYEHGIADFNGNKFNVCTNPQISWDSLQNFQQACQSFGAGYTGQVCRQTAEMSSGFECVNYNCLQSGTCGG